MVVVNRCIVEYPAVQTRIAYVRPLRIQAIFLYLKQVVIYDTPKDGPFFIAFLITVIFSPLIYEV
jgi:hypothetical protein